MSLPSGNRLPLDNNRRTLLGGLSYLDSTKSVSGTFDPATGAQLVSVISGGAGGVQYTDGAAAITHPIGTIPVFNNAGTITAVSVANPLPVSATISGAGIATSSNQTNASQKTQIVDGTGAVIGATSNALDVNVKSGGTSGTQYAEGVTTSPATGTVALGRYLSSAPGTLTNGQLSAPLMDSFGQLKVVPVGTATVSGTVTANAGTNLNTSLLALESGGNLATIAGKDFATQTTLAALNTKVTAVNTGAVVISSSALPSGASTSAKQPALGTAGSASADVITVQGIASGTALLTSQSGTWTNTVTQATGSNLHTVVDSGTITTLTGTTTLTPGTGATNLGKAEDAPHTSGDVGVMALAVRNDTGAVSAGSDGDYLPLSTDATGALRIDMNGTISTNNSTTSTLLAAAVFTGTSDDALNYNEIRISVIASHASATDGLSIQQSSDNTNWDITDTYTIPATTGKTYSVPRQARYFRVVYTNGGTNQTSFRLQTILNREGVRASSQRPNDAYSNETDLEQEQSFLMGYNGTTWDRLRSDTANGLDVDVTRLPTLVAGTAVIGKVGIDQTTPGTTNLVALAANQSVNNAQINGVTPLMGNGVTGTGSQRVTIASDNTAFSVNATLSAETTKVIGTVNQGTSPWVTSNATTSVVGNGASATAQRVTLANDSTGIIAAVTAITNALPTGTNSLGKISDITTSVVPGTAATNLGKAEDAAHTTGDTGVFALGVRNDTLADTTNATADYTQLSTDIKGRVITAGAPRSLKATAQVSVSNTTTETTIIAATASTFHDVYGLILANTGASTTKVSIRDTTAGTVKAIIEVPTLETRGFMLPVDSAMPQAAVNTNWTVQCGTATTALEVTAFYVSMV